MTEKNFVVQQKDEVLNYWEAVCNGNVYWWNKQHFLRAGITE